MARFGEGQPTDHGGRPRKPYSVTSMLREYGEEVDPETGLTRHQRLAKRLWTMVEDGDKWAIEEVVNRLEGRPKEHIEVSEDRVNRVIYVVDDGRSNGEVVAEATSTDKEPS